MMPEFARTQQRRLVHIHLHGDDDEHEYGEVPEAIALYSPSDRLCYELPPIPGFPRGFSFASQCVSLHGQIYVLGGQNADEYEMTIAEVYVLDVARCGDWERCADMEEGRSHFGCGVVDGKIYVLGGARILNPVRGCEVYDPELDAWSSIVPMPSLRDGHLVATVGEELFVGGGEIFDPAYLEFMKNDPTGDDYSNHKLFPEFLAVYHRVKDEWRKVDNTVIDPSNPFFTAKGMLQRMSLSGDIEVYDNEKNSWEMSCTSSFAEIGPVASVIASARSAVAVDNELFLRVHWFCTNDRDYRGADLLQTTEFEVGKKEIRWQKANCLFEFAKFDPCLCVLFRFERMNGGTIMRLLDQLLIRDSRVANRLI